VCNRALWFWKSAQKGAATSLHFEIARERAPTENLLPPALYAAQDQKMTGMFTGTHSWASLNQNLMALNVNY
jgi:hypothetical protein